MAIFSNNSLLRPLPSLPVPSSQSRSSTYKTPPTSPSKQTPKSSPSTPKQNTNNNSRPKIPGSTSYSSFRASQSNHPSPIPEEGSEFIVDEHGKKVKRLSIRVEQEGSDIVELKGGEVAEMAAPVMPLQVDAFEVIAKIEHTPTAWGANFWVVLADPLTQCCFYACPSTGNCSWDAPIGAIVVPRREQGEWWELADKRRGGRSYFYHTLTHKTQWTRPNDPDDFVIPLGMIQMNAIGSRALEESDAPSASPSPAPNRQRSHSHVEQTPTKSSTHGRKSSLGGLVLDSEGAQRTTDPPSPGDHRDLDAMSRHVFGLGSSPSIKRDNSKLSPLKIRPNKSSAESDANRNLVVVEHSNGGPTQNGGPSLFKPHTDSAVDITGTVNPTASPTRASRTASPLHRRTQLFSGYKSSVPPRTSIEESVSNGTGSESSMKSPPADKKAFVLNIHPWKGKGKIRMMEDIPPSSVEEANNNLRNRLWLKRNRGGKTLGTSASEYNLSSIRGSDPEDVLSAPDVVSRLNVMKRSASHDDFKKSITTAVGPGPIRVEPLPLNTKRLSTGLHPILPIGISTDIQAFQHNDFSKRYFAIQRQGLLRRKVPVDKVMIWQKTPLTTPLLMTSRASPRDPLRAFKIIQHVMFDRDRPVDIEPIRLSGPASAIFALTEHEEYHGREKLWTKVEKHTILEEHRWLLQLGITRLELRDELYCQLIKQLTSNPSNHSNVAGFRIFSTFVVCFPPSKDFEGYVRSFLKGRRADGDLDVGMMAVHCLLKLDKILIKGARQRAPTPAEIEQASDAAFTPCIFGESLESILEHQASTFLDISIPYVLPFLTQSIVDLGGFETEGLMRIPGDSDCIHEIKARLDMGKYHLAKIDDPNVPASLLKLFLRELAVPVIPNDQYNKALAVSSNSADCCRFIHELPPVHMRVLIFVIGFLQMLLQQNVLKETRMTAMNLALIAAPGIFRTVAQEATVVFTNAQWESKFVLNLLLDLDIKAVDAAGDIVELLPKPLQEARTPQ